MKWDRLITTKRFGMESYYQTVHDQRSEFQRDFDRMIFSAPFRRLQNKTQVFPLPGSVFVHNRLTHSLEVSSVGRSIASGIGRELSKKYPQNESKFEDIGSVVAAACLAHDMGNPPFGHSGENAIATYFSEGEGRKFKNQLNLSDKEWKDFVTFEGNANAFRLLTHQFKGRREGGFVLTYTTLSSIVKYPFESSYSKPGKQKFGFFQSEIDSYKRIADDLGIIINPYDSNKYARHPFVYIVEAADDICYQVMDIEDAFKLRLISLQQTKELLLEFFDEKRKQRFEEVTRLVSDANEQIAYLRSSVIGILIEAVSKTFMDNEDIILRGKLQGGLVDNLPESLNKAYKKCVKFSVENIYNCQMVVDIELAGYKIISELLNTLMSATFEPDKAYSKQILRRVPSQYDLYADSDYLKIMSILDFISGMTDVYALDLYRKINGTSLPSL